MQEETRESPLKVRLAGLARTISRLGYMRRRPGGRRRSLSLHPDRQRRWTLPASRPCSPNRLVLFGHILLHALTLAITVVVVAVPEGLPMMITVVLSSNMRRMLKDHVLVRKLVGIETSGSLNILFTDKTGTLTRGRLEVSRILTGDGTVCKRPEELAEKAGAMGAGRALLRPEHTKASVSDKAGAGRATPPTGRCWNSSSPSPERPPTRRPAASVPFDSARKFSALELRDGGNRTLIKGAPEKLLPACTRYYDEKGRIQPLNSRHLLETGWSDMTHHAMRVLALAVSETEVTEAGELSASDPGGPSGHPGRGAAGGPGRHPAGQRARGCRW